MICLFDICCQAGLYPTCLFTFLFLESSFRINKQMTNDLKCLPTWAMFIRYSLILLRASGSQLGLLRISLHFDSGCRLNESRESCTKGYKNDLSLFVFNINSNGSRTHRLGGGPRRRDEYFKLSDVAAHMKTDNLG